MTVADLIAERIPLPELGSAHHNPNLVSKADRSEVFKSLEDLKQPQYGSSGLQEYRRVFHQVQKYLKADGLPDFQLKPRTRSSVSKTGSNSSLANLASQLSPFAKMVLDLTTVPYRYPTPSTPSPPIKSTGRASGISAPAPQLTPQEHIAARNKVAFDENSAISPYAAKSSTPKKGAPVVLIPTLSAAEREKYVSLPESPKRRKLNFEEEVNGANFAADPQKREADTAVTKLLELLQEIFEEEDRFEPDTSTKVAQQHSTLFDAGLLNQDESPRLSVKTHTRIQNAIQAVIGFDKIQDVPLDYLKRVQRFCEVPILSIENLDLNLSAEANEDELSHWYVQLRLAENSAAAASTFMRIVLGNLLEKELFPAEVSSKLPEFLHRVIEGLLLPVAELRSSGKTAAQFTNAKSAKELLARLVVQSRKYLEIYTDLHIRMRDTDLAINAVVSLGPKLISVESAHSDKDSAIGSQNFESLRKVAMAVLAKIFSNYPSQQQSIIEGILNDLSKLPTAKQGARQYRLADGRAIQLVSALLMQLVQATATTPRFHKHRKLKSLPQGLLSDTGEDEEVQSESAGEDQETTSLDRLRASTKPMIASAHVNARRIIQGFLKRAVMSKQNRDDKHRNLLDLFIEDLISVICGPEWPASEILLRLLTSDLFYSITGKLRIEGEEFEVPTNMALELLGSMASAVLSLRGALAKNLAGHEASDHDISHSMRQLVDDQLSAGLRLDDILSVEGPFRVVTEHLEEKATNYGLIASAKSLFILQWADAICSVFDGENLHSQVVESLSHAVEEMLFDARYLETHKIFENITATQGRTAYLLVILNSGFCKYFDPILRMLINSINSDQVKTRSRSLKSIISLLEIDSKLLDKEPGIMRAIFRCTTDASPMVRDSALSLIGRYISITPSLLDEGCLTIFRCSSDPSVGVRKKCISLFKDIYRFEQRRDLQIGISDMILQRLQDAEDSVSGLARQTLEDLWFTDLIAMLAAADTDDRAKTKVAVSNQTEIIVRTLQRNEQNSALLENFLRTLFKEKAKTVAPLEKCCKAIVSDAFDKAVTFQFDRGSSNGESLLQTLTIFGRARPRLIDSVRLEALVPYLTNLKPKKAEEGDKTDELSLFQSVVAIFQSVIPHLSAMEKTLLSDVQQKLFQAISQLPKAVLDEVTQCLWTIHGVLQETTRFTRFAFSALKNGLSIRGNDLNDGMVMLRLRSYLRILGSVGKNWDLENQFSFFKSARPSTKETSVAGLFVEFIVPFTTPGQPLPLRAIALESLGSICQSWPGQFKKLHVQQSFSYVFSEDLPDLQTIVLQVFAGFFGIREHAIETFSSVKAEDEPEQQDLGRLSGSLRANEHDSAAAIIGSTFLHPMLSVAKTRLDQSALTAIRVVASINRQGLIHPKECVGAFVALGTSSNVPIAKVAVETHRILHQQHETMFEREYMRAVQETFTYQKDIVGNVLGASTRPYTPKLRPLFDIVKSSNAKYVKKFLSGMIAKSTFDPTKLESSGSPPDAVLFTRFIMQNLAFFDYPRLEDLLHVIGHIEGVIGKLGVDISQSIESEVLGTTVTLLPDDQNFQSAPFETALPPEPLLTKVPDDKPVDLSLLRRLATAATILSVIHETRTYLKRQYSIASAHIPNGKKDSKELVKPPSKAHGVTGDRFWENVNGLMSSMETEESMKARCQQFLMLMNVDEEVKVAADDADERQSWSASVDLEDSITNTPSGRKVSRGKRKSSVSIGGTPKKKRGRPRKSSVAHSDDSDDGWD